MAETAAPAVPDPTRGPATPDDIDGDGVRNDRDTCPSVANRDQRRACTYPRAPTPTGDVGTDGAAHLDWVRSLVGLGPVPLDPALSHACDLHLDYLVQASADLGRTILTHEEDLSKPYASEAGHTAGQESNLTYGGADIVDDIDGLLNAPYHRLGLLHPGLRSVGFAHRDGYGCVELRDIDVFEPVPFPIFWPPPDIVGTDATFVGEWPCPTREDPVGAGSLDPGYCPPSAAIPTLSLHGAGAISDAQATLTRIDTGESLPLFGVFHDGGPTALERAGYWHGSIAVVPSPGTVLARATYEVAIDAFVQGAPSSWRWRFTTGEPLPEAVACDDRADRFSYPSPVALCSEPVVGRVCGAADIYRIGGEGSRRVHLDFDVSEGQLALVVIDGSGAPTDLVVDPNGRAAVTVEAGWSIEVLRDDTEAGSYVLSSELVGVGTTACAACSEAQVSCAGLCVDLENDDAHCGACGRECLRGDRCVDGHCRACAGGLMCAGVCADIENDVRNCGVCGFLCSAGERCVEGQCETS